MLDEKGSAIPVKRKKRVVPAKWYGYSKKTKSIKEVITAWVETNFDKRLLSQIMNASNNKAAFVAVPPGADKKHDKEASKAPAVGATIKYKQKEGERTCMVYGMASVVHFAGAKQLASEI
jgi:hypothetical protein